VVPLILLALGACTGGQEPDQPDESFAVPEITGRGGTELPSQEDVRAALDDATEAFAGQVDAAGTGTGQVADAAAGPHVLRVVCTSTDGAPVTVSVSAAGADLTSYQAPCAPVFQGGSTMAESDAFEVPAGALDVSVAANSESVVAVGLVAAG